MKKKLQFIKKLTLIALPIILANLFLNIASLLDTMMVGQLDEQSISGVYIANQIIFVVNLMIFGSIEGASVFFCQFFGKKDIANLKKTFKFKIYASLIISILATIGVLTFGRTLSGLFTKDLAAIDISVSYLNILATSFIPFALTVCITSSMRESHNSVIPMIITLGGVVINFCVNYISIFGKLGIQPMGAVGAAIGTITERYIELLVLIIIISIKKFDFNSNFFKSFKIEKNLLISMTKKSIPLLLNETMWVLSQTVLVFIFSQTSEISTVVLPIFSTIFNLIFVICLGIGNGISILLGNTVGKGEFEEAQKEAYTSLSFSTITGIILGVILCLIAPIVTSLYKGVSLEARELAVILITYHGIYLLICSLNNAIFFTLRAGGRTSLVFIFDSCFGWGIQIPFAFLLLYAFKLEFIPLVITAYSIEIIKTIVGLILILSKKWYRNLTIGH